MAQESVRDYLKQIFSNRRYCPECVAMTPVLGPNTPKPGAVAVSGLYMEDYCEICRRPYEFSGLRRMRISETYGLAILNSDEAIKVVKDVKPVKKHPGDTLVYDGSTWE